MFERQAQHYLILAGLLAVITAVLVLNRDFLVGQFTGIPTIIWFSLAIAIPILHQIYGWFVWRSELHYSLISRWFGKNGFTYYAVGFAFLFISRLISIILLAISNRNTLSLPPTMSLVFTIVLLLPALYTFYSVHKYFGIKRALGIDHFDKTYRNVPFVKEGIFKFTDNAMYTYGLFILWIPGLLLFSKAALMVAMFNHIYVWVHYYCTELPDIHYIYSKKVI